MRSKSLHIHILLASVIGVALYAALAMAGAPAAKNKEGDPS